MNPLRPLDPNLATPLTLKTREVFVTPSTEERLDHNVNDIGTDARNVMEAEYERDMQAQNEQLEEEQRLWELENRVLPEESGEDVVAVTDVPFDLVKYQKDKHDEAMEHLQTACRGGLSESYRTKEGAQTRTSSGVSFMYVCSQNKSQNATGCPAKGVLKENWTWEAKAEHHPTCKCFNVYRGVLFSDRVLATTGATTKNSRKIQDSIIADNLGKGGHAHTTSDPVIAGLKALIATIEPATELHAQLSSELSRRIAALPSEVFVRAAPSIRAIGHINRGMRGKTTFTDADRGDIDVLLDEFHAAQHPNEATRPPRTVRVLTIESWLAVPSSKKQRGVKRESSQGTQAHEAGKSRKTGQTKPATAAPPVDDKEPVMDRRSMIVFTTDYLMDLCRAHRHASIDGTYRCAPGKATIANFGVFLGRSYVPCFMGIMSGERSGDTTDHWVHFLSVVQRALGSWAPETCVRDHASCLINALNAVWPLCLQLVCWFHIRKNIRTMKPKMPSLAAKYTEVMKIVRVLHYSTPEMFPLAMEALVPKLPAVFREYFFVKTAHGAGLVNEAWAFNLIAPGESCTNSATESFHRQLHTEHFGGEINPSFKRCCGLLGMTLQRVEARCKVPSRYGKYAQTENQDRIDKARVRNAWKRAALLADSDVLQKTHTIKRRSVFFILPGSNHLTQKAYETLQTKSTTTAAAFLKFWEVRRVTEKDCTCHKNLFLGYCSHMFAVRIHVHGEGVIPQDVMSGSFEESAAPDRSDEDSEEEAGADDDREPDTDEDGEDAVAPLPAVRSRRLAVIVNVSDW